MTKAGRVGLTLVAGLTMVALTGCEWDGSSGSNSSRGAGAGVNFSGVYRSDATSIVVGKPITRLVLTQSGNNIQARDNNGSTYSGSVGAPGVLSSPGADGTYAARAALLQAQINFSGTNKDSGESAEFTGIIRAVAVSDVNGVSTTATVGDEDISSTSTYEFTITESNTRYILEGNWMEGGDVSGVNGFAQSASGTFTASP